jgi:hypothetical protein
MRPWLPVLFVFALACGDKGDVDIDGDGVPASRDCDDRDERVNPGAVERCGGGDEDCDGLVDDEDPDLVDGRAAWADVDLDGYGDPDVPLLVCVIDEGVALNADDCDDSDPAVSPAAVEVCGGGDEDCDGRVDTEDPSLVDGLVAFPDGDGDGYGLTAEGTIVCELPPDQVAEGGDCDDADPSRSPGLEEVCNERDDDCDGLVDLDDPDGIADATWFLDEDGDGYGDPAFPVVTCGEVDGLVPNGDDCNDARADVAPGAAEVCDGLDNDCDLLVDGADSDLVGGETFYADADADGYGDLASFMIGCERPLGFVDNADDCADDDRLVNPSRDEICDDGIDNDCDGAVGGDCLGLEGRTEVEVVLSGEAVGSRFGSWISAFDDGDGLGDLSVGAPGYAATGRASLFLGPLLDRVDPAAEVVLTGDPGSELGTAAVYGADLDGDGQPDWAVSAPAGGQVLLFSDPLVALPSGPEDAAVILTEPDPGSWVGAALALAVLDDVGTTGLVVGVPLAESPSVDGGEVYVLAAPLVDGPIAGAALGVLRGVNVGHEAGAALATGDLDGDGVDEIVVGAPYVATGKGTAYIVSGPVPADLPLNAAAGVWSGQVIDDVAGSALSIPGDANGDGRADLMIGAPGTSRGAAGGGSAYLLVDDILSGVKNLVTADLILDGVQLGEAAGASVGGADTTGDGQVALLIGASEYDDVGEGDGVIYVVSGSLTGVVELSDAEGVLVPGAAASGFGGSVLGVDLDGDGWQDVAVGAPLDDIAGIDAGAVYLWQSSGGSL